MSKKLLYLVFDCETATLPFANEIAKDDADRKKKIAIAKPLIYDIGYTICDRAGNIIERKQYLVAETFSVPSIFNTAYYKEKRPIYLEILRKNEISIRPWNEIMDIFIKDMNKVHAIGAFNSMFDFKKAIPFTELYISKLYSEDYYKWEEWQYKICEKIANGEKIENKNEFEPDIFRFRNNEYELFDLWGLAVTHLLNNASYKRECLKHGLLTNTGIYFKSSAESTYKYLCDKYDFIEAHTALEDAIIESYILHKIAKKHAITAGIKYFPFRDLGYTTDFCQRLKVANIDECNIVYNNMAIYVNAKIDEADENGKDISIYVQTIINKMRQLAQYMGIECNY